MKLDRRLNGMRIALTLAVVLAIGMAAYLVFGRGREIQGGDARKRR